MLIFIRTISVKKLETKTLLQVGLKEDGDLDIVVLVQEQMKRLMVQNGNRETDPHMWTDTRT